MDSPAFVNPIAPTTRQGRSVSPGAAHANRGEMSANGPPANGPSAKVVATQCYGPVAGFMPAVERVLQDELRTRIDVLAPLLRHGVQLGGKRLRPALVLLAGMAVDAERVDAGHVTLAAVLEMVHTATLIHDDVLDEADTRRRVATINSVWGDHVSILLGDYLFSQAFRLSATLGSTEACRQIGEASRRVCEGELRQVLSRNRLDLSEADYLQMIEYKTGELCGVACRLGAVQSGGDERLSTDLAAYGSSLGVAFQIVDDYLDLWGDSAAVGKTLGTDVAQGKWTLPVLRLWRTAAGADRQRLQSILSGPVEARLPALLPMLNDSDAAEYTLRAAEDCRERACDALTGLRNTPAKRSLIDLASFAVARTY